jgi:hypothetical protein
MQAFRAGRRSDRLIRLSPNGREFEPCYEADAAKVRSSSSNEQADRQIVESIAHNFRIRIRHMVWAFLGCIDSELVMSPAAFLEWFGSVTII